MFMPCFSLLRKKCSCRIRFLWTAPCVHAVWAVPGDAGIICPWRGHCGKQVVCRQRSSCLLPPFRLSAALLLRSRFLSAVRYYGG